MIFPAPGGCSSANGVSSSTSDHLNATTADNATGSSDPLSQPLVRPSGCSVARGGDGSRAKHKRAHELSSPVSPPILSQASSQPGGADALRSQPAAVAPQPVDFSRHEHAPFVCNQHRANNCRVCVDMVGPPGMQQAGELRGLVSSLVAAKAQREVVRLRMVAKSPMAHFRVACSLAPPRHVLYNDVSLIGSFASWSARLSAERRRNDDALSRGNRAATIAEAGTAVPGPASSLAKAHAGMVRLAVHELPAHDSSRQHLTRRSPRVLLRGAGCARL